MWKFISLLGLTTCFFCLPSTAQLPSYNFRHITTSDGLSSSVIRGIAQDKYGYIWEGSPNGLSRFNGYTVQNYEHADNDSLSLPDNAVQDLLCDSNHLIWVALREGGLCHYDYKTSHFIQQPAARDIRIRKMTEAGEYTIYCVTSKGLALFHPSSGALYFPGDHIAGPAGVLLHRKLNDLSFGPEGRLYLATDTGLVVYDPRNQQAVHVLLKPLRGKEIGKVITDGKGDVWISYGDNGEKLLKTDPSFSSCQLFPDFGADNTTNHISAFFLDNHKRLWIGTTGSGLSMYDPVNHRFNYFNNDPFQPKSLSSYNITNIFQDGHGFIWVGTEGYGLDYFHPDENLFHCILPNNNQSKVQSDNWGRAAAEDTKGNLWLGSVIGVTRIDAQTGKYSYIQNTRAMPRRLYSNAVLSLLYDDHGYLWIGTSSGLNRFNPVNGHVDFFGERDSLPCTPYWSVMQDRNKEIWIGSKEGLYRYDYTTGRFDHFGNDPLLKGSRDFAIKSLFEDSRGRIWIGTCKSGLLLYDHGAGKLQHWMKSAVDTGFIDNDIRSFAEDRGGTIWIGSNGGIAGFDPQKGEFRKFGQEEGLKTESTGGLMVDNRNRLWVSTGNGLFVLDSTRSYFKSFVLEDGLPSQEFNAQAAFKTARGEFVYPAVNGFLVFNPEEYKEVYRAVEAYVSNFRNFGKDYTPNTNVEEVKELWFDYDQNFFSFAMSAFNYSNPDQTWYAFKLEPFDKEWISSIDRFVNYTNVPSGDYIFRYKASVGPENWRVPEKIIKIHIATVFYKTGWFRGLMVLLVVLALYLFFRYRISQRDKIYSLQNKAQLLEKEKAVVMYESLKQQLNPHFLFNSLTSLSGLIEADQKMAGVFLEQMSKNYRYILKSRDTELVTVKEELDFVRTYINLQLTRFQKGLEVHIDVSGDSYLRKIVPVTLQNLIENAVKHNIIDADTPLVIELYTEEAYFVVRNNIQKKNLVQESNRLGLASMESLYKFLTSTPIVISDDEKYFTVKIPFI